MAKEDKTKAKRKTNVSFQSTLHSCATQPQERCTDIKLIHKLLSHNDIKTILIYIHEQTNSSGHKSRFDDLNIENLY
jgi:site-specific recombinase XerD